MRRSLILLGLVIGLGFPGQALAQSAGATLVRVVDAFCRGEGLEPAERETFYALREGGVPAGTLAGFSFETFELNVANPVRAPGGAIIDVALIRVPGQPVSGCVVTLNDRQGLELDHGPIRRAFADWARRQSPRLSSGMNTVPQDGGGHVSGWSRTADRGQPESVVLFTRPFDGYEAGYASVIHAYR